MLKLATGRSGSFAAIDYKPRQVRKEATVVNLFVCFRVARLSFFLASPPLHRVLSNLYVLNRCIQRSLAFLIFISALFEEGYS